MSAGAGLILLGALAVFLILLGVLMHHVERSQTDARRDRRGETGAAGAPVLGGEGDKRNAEGGGWLSFVFGDGGGGDGGGGSGGGDGGGG